MRSVCSVTVIIALLFGSVVAMAQTAISGGTSRTYSRLASLGSGDATFVRMALRDRETLRGSIAYLTPEELGLANKNGSLRVVPLEAINDFEGRNRETGTRAVSASRFKRAGHTFTRKLHGPPVGSALGTGAW